MENNNIQIADKNFKAMFHLNPRGCMMWDMDLKVLDWNRAAEKMFGYPADEIIGKTLHETVLRGLVDGDEVVGVVWKQVSESTDGFQNINKNKRKDGSIITCDWYNSPVFDDDGSPLHIISEAVDITHEMKRCGAKEELEPFIKKKSEELEENLSRFKELLSGVNRNLSKITASINENRKETEKFSNQFHEIDEILLKLDDIVNISHINQINLRIQASRLSDQRHGDAFKVIGTQFDGANKKIENLINEMNVFYQKIESHLSGMKEKFTFLLEATESQQGNINEVESQYHSVQEYLIDFNTKVSEYLTL